jgi:hypothetical protein
MARHACSRRGPEVCAAAEFNCTCVCGADSYLGSAMAKEAAEAAATEASGKTVGTEAQHAEFRGTYGASWLKQVCLSLSHTHSLAVSVPLSSSVPHLSPLLSLISIPPPPSLPRFMCMSTKTQRSGMQRFMYREGTGICAAASEFQTRGQYMWRCRSGPDALPPLLLNISGVGVLTAGLPQRGAEPRHVHRPGAPAQPHMQRQKRRVRAGCR